MENPETRLTAFEEAETYFEDLWQRERPRWLAGDVTPAAMQNGVTVPVDYCLTTVARLVAQPQAPVKAVENILEQLKASGGPNFFYPLESIHISLLGCTSRAPSKDAFDAARIERIRQVCLETLGGREVVKMSLRGVGILGNQVFIQVFPHDRRWAEMRRELEKALLETGERPITFPNKAPIHMNILRVTNGDKAGLGRLLKAIEQLNAVEPGDFNVSVIDFMLTDFVLSPGNVRFIDRIVL